MYLLTIHLHYSIFTHTHSTPTYTHTYTHTHTSTHLHTHTHSLSLSHSLSLACTPRPLLPGDSEIDQLQRIFSLLGTPTTRIWPDVSSLSVFAPPPRHHHSSSSSGSSSSGAGSEEPPYRLNLTQEQRRHPFSNLQAMFPCPAKIGERGLECLDSLLTFDPKQRTTVRTWHASRSSC